MSQVTDPPRAPEFDPRPFLSHPDARYEIEDGKVVEIPTVGAYAQFVAMAIYNLLRSYLEANPLGLAHIESMFVLDAEGRFRRNPDVAFVTYDRWPSDRLIPEEGDWQVVPDLAIEVVSPNDLHRTVHAKINEYFRFGVRQVWSVDPFQRQIAVYDGPTRVRILTEADTLDGGDLLPGFSVPVARLFRRTPR